MRLYLAVAVLMLAFVAYTEAQSQDPTQEQGVAQFTELGRTIVEKAKENWDTLQNSEFAVRAKKWFTEITETIGTKIADLSQ